MGVAAGRRKSRGNNNRDNGGEIQPQMEGSKERASQTVKRQRTFRRMNVPRWCRDGERWWLRETER